MGKKTWTKDNEEELKRLHNSGMKYQDIADKLNKTLCSVSDKILRMGISNDIIKSNNPLFKAIYQDYDWCYERYVLKGMTHQEMAIEANASKRVIQKWCVEIHKIHGDNFKELYKLNETQRELIISGTLGDGHIDRRIDQPMYIECHAEDEKDYMFWKYSILKNICNKEPVYKSKNIIKHFNEKEYICKPSYRLCSRIVYDLKPIREMSIIEKISNLTEFGLSTYILDDGYRSESNWIICVAMFNREDKEVFIRHCKDSFELICWIQKDERYIVFDSNSSRKMDDIILKTIPNELDIIQKKILSKKITEENNYIMVVDGEKKLGLSHYYKKENYEKIKTVLKSRDIKEIELTELQKLYNKIIGDVDNGKI